LVSHIKGRSKLKWVGNGVLRITFGTKRGKIIENWKRMHNEEPRDFYSFSFFLLAIYCRCSGLLSHLITLKDTQTHTEGFLWTRDWPVEKAST
jgi:hypothetical protein